MKQYYECHLTIEPNFRTKEEVKNCVEQLGWKFSSIDGDPELGDGIKYYATKHFNERFGIKNINFSLDITYRALSCGGILVIRKKIELVVYDERPA